MATHRIEITTQGRGFYPIDKQVNAVMTDAEQYAELCHVFLHHTSASLILCENADPDVQRDLERFFARLVPDGDPLFRHTAEGPDDMPAHVRTVLTQNSITIPVARRKLVLGTWQGLYVWEHRRGTHRRKLTVTCIP